jgi:hypothetical protein
MIAARLKTPVQRRYSHSGLPQPPIPQRPPRGATGRALDPAVCAAGTLNRLASAVAPHSGQAGRSLERTSASKSCRQLSQVYS